jgi:hypothetical protein
MREQVMNIIWSGLYLAAMAVVLFVFQGGLLLAGDAFFLAASIIAVFTGHWVIASEGGAERPVASTRFASAGVSYAVCLVVGGMITVQALTMI